MANRIFALVASLAMIDLGYAPLIWLSTLLGLAAAYRLLLEVSIAHSVTANRARRAL